MYKYPDVVTLSVSGKSTDDDASLTSPKLVPGKTKRRKKRKRMSERDRKRAHRLAYQKPRLLKQAEKIRCVTGIRKDEAVNLLDSAPGKDRKGITLQSLKAAMPRIMGELLQVFKGQDVWDGILPSKRA